MKIRRHALQSIIPPMRCRAIYGMNWVIAERLDSREGIGIIMYCQSCGAPMTLFRERDYFFCEYCGAYHFPTPTLEGIRLLGEAPDGIPCPVCRTKLHLASLDGRTRGYHCPRCRGILLDRFDFRDTLYARRSAATQPPAPPQPLDRTQLARRVHCPRCGRPMDTHPYLGPGNIIIDTCDLCNLIWLDGMELEQATNAPGLDRSPAHSLGIGSKKRW